MTAAARLAQTAPMEVVIPHASEAVVAGLLVLFVGLVGLGATALVTARRRRVPRHTSR